MSKPLFPAAFSTVACPDWNLSRVARAAAAWGFGSVELRTFGQASTTIACEPALTAASKVRETFRAAGVRLASLATGVRFDAPVQPPLLGYVLGDDEASVRLAKAAIDLAAQLECPFVRVFGFELTPGERRAAGEARIVRRLALAVDAARNTGVRLVLENGGSFPRAADLAAIIDRLGSPLLGASYSMPAAHAAGEHPADGVATLGDRLWIARIKDMTGPDALNHRHAVALGRGVLPCREFVESLAAAGFRGSLVYEWDRLWLPDLAPAEDVLPLAAERIYAWQGAPLAHSTDHADVMVQA